MSDNTQRRPLSKAQTKHLHQLRQEAQQAQAALVRHINYLIEEHEIPNDGTWALGADAFEKQARPDAPQEAD